MSEDASKTLSFAGLFARIRALATTAITWLMALAVVLPFVATQITDEGILQWIARITIWIGSAILMLRRIVELPKDQRGILDRHLGVREGPGDVALNRGFFFAQGLVQPG